MQRINTPNKAVDLYGVGKHGYQGGNPATNTPATQLDPAPLNALQEEIANTIELSGQALNPAVNTQLHDAVVRIAASPPAPPLSANGGEAVTASWVRSQIIGDGVHPIALKKVAKTLPAGTDPDTLFESDEYAYDIGGSQKFPAGIAAWVYLKVIGSVATGPVPTSGWARQILYSFYSDVVYTRRLAPITHGGVGVLATPWIAVGAGTTGAAVYAGTPWANVTASRAWGITYTNTSTTQNKEVFVELLDNGVTPGNMQITVGGVLIGTVWSAATAFRRNSASFTVPPNTTYVIIDVNASTTSVNWSERLL